MSLPAWDGLYNSASCGSLVALLASAQAAHPSRRPTASEDGESEVRSGRRRNLDAPTWRRRWRQIVASCGDMTDRWCGEREA
eukprot:6172719-Pleurochrysis_carterae.AAC.7